MQCPWGSKESVRSPGSRVTGGVLGIEPRTSEIAAIALNLWATSLVPRTPFWSPKTLVIGMNLDWVQVITLEIQISSGNLEFECLFFLQYSSCLVSTSPIPEQEWHIPLLWLAHGICYVLNIQHVFRLSPIARSLGMESTQSFLLFAALP